MDSSSPVIPPLHPNYEQTTSYLRANYIPSSEEKSQKDQVVTASKPSNPLLVIVRKPMRADKTNFVVTDLAAITSLRHIIQA